MEDKIFALLTEKDDLSWQSTLFDLVNAEGMDPWDVDVSLLAQKFLDRVRQMRGMDLRISGKMVLAAAILLRIKSKRLVGADIDALDKLFAQGEGDEKDLLFEEQGTFIPGITDYDPKKLIPRTPQPRKRKVSIYDLVNALQKALEVNKRKVVRDVPEMNFIMPKRGRDVGQIIKDVYGKIKLFFSSFGGARMTFTNLLPANPSKEDKVFAFIPLLHLTNQRRINLEQQQHFGEIEIRLLQQQLNKEVEKELLDKDVEEKVSSPVSS